MSNSIFISYIHREEEVAEYIADSFTKTFSDEVNIYLSGRSMNAGDWLEQLKEAISRSTVIMPLMSRTSRHSPWINFECGFAYCADITIIPMCHKDLQPKDLNQPYSK